MNRNSCDFYGNLDNYYTQIFKNSFEVSIHDPIDYLKDVLEKRLLKSSYDL